MVGIKEETMLMPKCHVCKMCHQLYRINIVAHNPRRIFTASMQEFNQQIEEIIRKYSATKLIIKMQMLITNIVRTCRMPRHTWLDKDLQEIVMDTSFQAACRTEEVLTSHHQAGEEVAQRSRNVPTVWHQETPSSRLPRATAFLSEVDLQ